MARIKLVKDKPVIRPSINIGATIDIPTANFVTGSKGETITVGGLSPIEGFFGLGNNFKSTIMHFFMVRAADRIECSLPDKVTMHTYDTENNMALNIEHLDNLADNITCCLPKKPIENGIWEIISKADMPAEEWVNNVLYKLPELKKEDKDAYIEINCFKGSDGKPMKMLYPTFLEIDSLTEFEPSTTMELMSKVKDLDKLNMLHMNIGKFKAAILKDLPNVSNKGNIYMLVTAHLGKKKDVGGNPYQQPAKELQYLKQDEVIKGTTDKLNFLTTHLWRAFGATVLKNPNTKLPEYPTHDDDVETDLNIVKLMMTRSKTGHSGFTLEIIVSQSEGVLPELTEFHYLKSNKFGIGGNPRSYYLELKPDVKLSRTTVRNKLKEDYRLARAANILVELHQITKYKPQYKDLICSPTELYEDMVRLGYDWNVLLNTRGWWTVDNYTTKLKPFLSTIDLLKMRKGLYTPFWIDEKTKQPKKEWLKHFETSNKK